MSNKLKLVIVACVAALCIALAGCGSSNSLAGTWDYDEATLAEYVGEDLTPEQIEAAKKIMFVQFKDDGTVAFVMYGDVMEGTWKDDKGNLTVEIEGEPWKATLVDGKLTLDDGEDPMGFVKASGTRDIPTDDITNEALSTMLGFALGDIEVEETSADIEDSSIEIEGTSDDVEAEFSDEDYLPKELTDLAEPVTVADDGTCTITVTGTGVNGFGDPGYNLNVVNKSDKAIYVTEQEFTVGGKEVAAYSDETVDAGATKDVFLAFDALDLGDNASVESLVDVKGVLEVDDDESVEEIATYNFSM